MDVPLMAAYAVQQNLRARGEQEQEEAERTRVERPEEPPPTRVDGKLKPSASKEEA